MNSFTVNRRRTLRSTFASALLVAMLPTIGVLANASSASALTTTTISVGGNPGAIASNGSYVWLATGGTLTQLNAHSGAVLQSGVDGGGSVDQVTMDANFVWADNQGHSTITQLNAATGAYQGYYSVKNSTSHTIGSTTMPWSFSFTLPSGTSLQNLWGARFVATSSGGVTTVTVTAPSYDAGIAPNKFATVYFIIAGSTTPSNCLAGGSACTP